jgi:hypothetical protein
MAIAGGACTVAAKAAPTDSAVSVISGKRSGVQAIGIPGGLRIPAPFRARAESAHPHSRSDALSPRPHLLPPVWRRGRCARASDPTAVTPPPAARATVSARCRVENAPTCTKRPAVWRAAAGAGLGAGLAPAWANGVAAGAGLGEASRAALAWPRRMRSRFRAGAGFGAGVAETGTGAGGGRRAGFAGKPRPGRHGGGDMRVRRGHRRGCRGGAASPRSRCPVCGAAR